MDAEFDESILTRKWLIFMSWVVIFSRFELSRLKRNNALSSLDIFMQQSNAYNNIRCVTDDAERSIRTGKIQYWRIKEVFLNCFENIILGASPASLHILTTDIGQWRSHVCVLLTILVQEIGKTKQLTIFLLVVRNRSSNYGFHLSGARSKASLPNEAT